MQPFRKYNSPRKNITFIFPYLFTQSGPASDPNSVVRQALEAVLRRAGYHLERALCSKWQRSARRDPPCRPTVVSRLIRLAFNSPKSILKTCKNSRLIRRTPKACRHANSRIIRHAPKARNAKSRLIRQNTLSSLNTQNSHLIRLAVNSPPKAAKDKFSV